MSMRSHVLGDAQGKEDKVGNRASGETRVAVQVRRGGRSLEDRGE